jgi:hypothetical protein
LLNTRGNTRAKVNALVGLAIILLIAFCLSSCASYTARALRMRELLSEEDYEKTLQKVEKIDKNTSALLYLYEKGLVLHNEGSFEESNQSFEKSDLLLEDLYTRSVSREVGALVTSDVIIKYRGERFEAALIHYYKILNYLYLGQPEEALVECRKLNHKLQTFLDQEGSYYVNDPFLQYLTGMIYLMEGEHVDANVSLRVALEWYQKLHEAYQVEIPELLYCDLVKSAEALGESEEAELYRKECGRPGGKADDDDWGAVNIFLECGYVPFKREVNIVLPIFKDEVSDDWDKDALAVTLADRHGAPVVYGREVEYLLKVSIPEMVVELSRFGYAKIRTVNPEGPYGREVSTTLVENPANLALSAFEERKATILLKTVLRGLAKYLGTSKAEEEKGWLFGWIVNLFGVATETADTRSWTTLPEKILMARLELPEGQYDISVDVFGVSEELVESFTIPDVNIRAGRTTFLNYRVH